MADFILSVPLSTASGCISTTCSTNRIHQTHKKFRFNWRPKLKDRGELEENNLASILITVLAITSFLHAFRNRTQLLTNNGDAAFSSNFYHFVHQGFGSFGKLVPLKDSYWTIPHDLLGPSHNFNKLLHTLRATVQALREVRGHSLLTPSSNHPCPARASPSPQTNRNFSPFTDRFASSCCRRVESGGIYLPNTS